MAQLVEHLNLFDEVFESFSSHVPLAKLFDCDLGAHPLGLEDVTVTTTANKVFLRVDFKLLKVNIEVEAILFQ